MNAREEVVIVGGGVIGCAIAYYLAKAGVTSCVLERGRIGGEASRAAAGLLAPFAESYRHPALRGPGLESLDLFPPLAEELRDSTGIDIDYVPSGLLRLATDEAQVEALSGMAASDEAAAMGLSWLSPQEAMEMVPGLTPSLHGALFSPREGHIDGLKLTRALARAAAGLGVRLVEGAEVTGFLRQGMRVTGVTTAGERMECGHVVLATGAWSGGMARSLGMDLPVAPVRGQILSLQPAPAAKAPRQIMFYPVDRGVNYVVSKRDGSVWVGATQEETAGFHQQVTAEGVAGLLSAALRVLPALSGAALLQAWCGLRPGTPDGMPVLGPAGELEGLVLATGHFRSGILLAPITGRLIADYVIKDDLAPLRPFSLARFEHS